MNSPPAALNLACLLTAQAAKHPAHTVVHFLKDGETTAANLTFGQLWARSAGISRRLREQFPAGERIGILHEMPHDFLCSFFGCQLGGFIAVPLPATGRKTQQRIRSTAYMADANAAAVLTDERGQAKLPPLPSCELIVTSTLAPAIEEVDRHPYADVGGSEPAYLQYTSGSTGSPKGVCITHANVMANLRQITERLELSPGTSIVSWLPHHHDQGLVGSLLLAVFLAGTVHAMTPAAFVARPLRWLEVISRYRGHLSGGPNFAFDYCTRAARQAEQPLQLDLSTWRVAYNGAERVFPETLDEFTDCFARYGFRRSAWSPSYGLAEATLAVSMMRPLRGSNDDNILTVEREGALHVACGPAMQGTEIRIAAADTGLECAPGQLGEIWLRGPSIAARYWKHAMSVETPEPGEGGAYLRTGDFGFLESGNLFVVGRREDRFKIRGRNVFAADLERACRCADFAVADCAAFTTDLDAMPHLAVELRRASAGKVELARLADSIADAVYNELDVQPAAIHFVRQGSLPRTTSGKLRRAECARLVLGGRLESLGVYAPAQGTGRGGHLVADPLLRNVRAMFGALGLDAMSQADADAVIRLDSIDHARVHHALETTFGVHIGVWSELATLRDVCDVIRAGEEKHPSVRAADPTGTVGMSDLQHDVLIADRLCGSALFTVGCVIRMEGTLSRASLSSAVKHLLDRHPILACGVVEGSTGEFILQRAGREPVVEELPCQSDGEHEAVDRWFAAPIPLGPGPLVRVGLRHEPGASCILIAAHHIVADHGSLLRLSEEVEVLCRDPRTQLPPVVSHEVFAAEHAQIVRSRGAELRTFWGSKLRQLVDPPLLSGAMREPIRHWGVHHVSRELSHETLQAIVDCSSGAGASISTVILAAYALLIMRCTGKSDIVLSSAVTLRDSTDFANTIGYLVNTVPLLVRVDAGARFADLCRTVRAELEEARGHAALAQHLLGREIAGMERADTLSPLTRYVFNFLDERALRPSVDPRPSHPLAELQLTVRLRPGCLRIEVSSLAERYERELLEQLADSMVHLLSSAPRHPGRLLRAVEVLSPAQVAHLRSFDGPTLTQNRRRLDEWIGSQAALHVDRVAVTAPMEDGAWEHLTYSALDERACAVASVLPRVRGAAVAIIMERSIQQIVATLGVLRAGAVYMPVDPQLPALRIISMLEDAGAACVLTDSLNLGRLRDAGIPARVLTCDRSSPKCSLPDPSDQEPAALMYTSGSSGRPKGVLLAHSVYAARFLAMQQELAIDAEDVFLQKTSISFDVSLWEIFLPLVSGARLVMAPRAASFDAQLLTSILERAGVSTVHFVPTMLREWLAGGEPGRAAAHLRRCLCSGEALRAEDRDLFVQVLPNTRLVNLYGPTECGIDVTWTTELGQHGEPPIGWPTRGSRLDVVSDHQLVPPGIPGELTIAGPQLAIGYWGRPDLTAARFVPAEGGGVGERAYLSGDQALWRADGQLAYLGRMDGQVKVRGVRIELSEVRHAILDHPHVAQAEVLVVGRSGVQTLAAAIVSGHPLTPAQIQEHLFERIPASAVPTLIQILPSLPVLPNGKCDLDRLRAAFEAVSVHLPASATPVSAAVAQAWHAVLGVWPSHGARFFACGGDSVKAIRLVNELAKQGIRACVAEIYRWQSIEEQSRHFPAPRPSSPEGLDYQRFSLLTAKAREGLDLESLDDAYPLSALQRSVVMQSFGEARYETYVSGMRVQGAFRLAAFEAAVSRLMRAHPFLRSSIDLTRGAEPLQLVHKVATPQINVRDLRALEMLAARRDIEEWTERELHQVFRWDEAPLLRFTVHLLEGGEFVVSMTEAALDGWCVALAFRDLLVGYDAFMAGRSLPMPPELPGYGVFVKLERDAIASEQTREHWRERVQGLLPQLCPRWPFPRASVRSHRRTEIKVPATTVHMLEALAASHGWSLKQVFFALYTVMLAVLRERGTVIAMIECNGRPECQGGDGLIGVFNNILPAQVRVAGRTWAQLAGDLYEIEAGLQRHRRFPIAEVLRELGGRTLGDALFVFTRFHVLDELASLESIRVQDAWASDETYLALTFHVNDSPWHGVRILLDYDAADFPPAQIEWLAGWLRATLAKLPTSLDTCCLPAEPVMGGPGQARWGELLPVSDRVLRQCRLRPAAQAMVEGGRSMTYLELQHRLLQVARQLSERGVQPGESIGLVANAGIDVVCVMLGAWLAGICCVLLDPAQPRRRVAAQLAGCAVQLVLFEEEARDLASVPTPDVAAGAAPPAPVMVHPLQTAYILHTSGSSGKPKPVAVAHAALSNYVANALALYQIGPGQRVWSHSSIGFDFTLTTLIAPLCAGASVHVTPRDDFSSMFRSWARSDVIKLTPTHIQLLQRHPDVAPARLPSRIIVGGELLQVQDVQALARLNARVRVFNEYGPTEACVGCCVEECDACEGREGHPVAAIGRSIEGMRVHLLDGHLTPIVASHVVGELYLSGIGVALGHPGHAAGTSERFLPCPFGPPGSVMYRTGDAAKYIDGKLVCLGRVDRQVKVRGHRVELEEVESCLASCAEVARAACDLRDGRLVAWILPRHPPLDTPRLHLIRLHLESHLPDYMRPQRVYEMKAVPLTNHGKMDCNALSEEGEPVLPVRASLMEWAALGSSAATSPAATPGSPAALVSEDPRRSQWQEKLAAIWAEVLEVPAVVPEDNYFRLGGDSVSSILITAKARALGIPLTTRLLLENATLEALVTALLAVAGADPAFAGPRELATAVSYPLTPMQNGILHDCLLAPQEELYESHLVLEVAGEIDPALLALAWNQTFRANSVLRNRFTTGSDGLPIQTADDAANCDLVVIDCQDEPTQAQSLLQETKDRFSARCRGLDRAPLCGLALLRLAVDRGLLLLTHHHLILDGWSQQLVLEELFETYAAYRRGLEAPEVARVPFERYVSHVRSRPFEPAFWRDYLGGIRPGRPMTRSSDDRRVATRAMSIPAATWSSLATRALECGTTVAGLIQVGWALALAAVTDAADVIYGLTISGRDTSFEQGQDFSSVVGMCINTLPIRASLDSRLSIESWLRQQQRNVWAVMARQHEALSDIQRATAQGQLRAPLFDSIVVVENLPTPRQVDPQLSVVGFEIKEGLPIVLVVFCGREPRIELRVQPARCMPRVPDRLAEKLLLALESLGSANSSTSLEALLSGVKNHSPGRGIPITAFGRIPV